MRTNKYQRQNIVIWLKTLHGLNDSSRRTGLFLTRADDRYKDAEADDSGYNDASNGPNRQGVTERQTTKSIMNTRV